MTTPCFLSLKMAKMQVLDMKPMLDFACFSESKDLDKFKRVRIAFDTIEWDCGVDLIHDYFMRTPEFDRVSYRIKQKKIILLVLSLREEHEQKKATEP